MKIGLQDILGGFVGNQPISRVYVGDTLVFPKSPINLTPPAIAGINYATQTITSTAGTWSDADTVTREWFVNDSATGFTDLTLLVSYTFEGFPVKLRETATNANGSTIIDSNVINFWSPKELTGNFGYWDAQDINSFSVDMFGFVSSWSSKGTISEMLQPNALINSPWRDSAWSGSLAAVDYIAGNNLQGTSLSNWNFVHNGSTTFVISAISSTDATEPQNLVNNSIGTAETGFSLRFNNTAFQCFVNKGATGFRSVAYFGNTGEYSTYLGTGINHILEAFIDADNVIADDRIDIEVFASSIKTATNTASELPSSGDATFPLLVGQKVATFDQTFIGQIHFLFIGDNIAIADIERLEGFLAWRIGEQLNLPLIHPYRSNPPLSP